MQRINVPTWRLGVPSLGDLQFSPSWFGFVFAFSVIPSGSNLLRAKSPYLCIPRAQQGPDPSEMLLSEAQHRRRPEAWVCSCPTRCPPNSRQWGTCLPATHCSTPLLSTQVLWLLWTSSTCPLAFLGDTRWVNPPPPNPRPCRRREPGCPGLGEEGWQLRIKLSRHTPATPHPGHLGSTRFSRGRRVACLTCFLEMGGLRNGFSPGSIAHLLCHHGRLPALCKPLFPHLSLGWTPSAPV